LAFAVVGGIAVAQEEVPEGPPAEAGSPATETTYLDLRRSKDRTTRQWAERYFTLTKLQEWSSAKGKKVKAKYVSHTADLASVTLAVAGGEEATVPVAQLDKASQSRVKQIAATQKKLDELIAGGAKADAAQPGETPGSDPGAPMVDERGVQPPPRQRQPAVRRPARTVPDEPSAQPPATPDAPLATATAPADDGDPDPLGFGELPANASPSVPNFGREFPATPTTVALPPDGVALRPKNPGAKDQAAWRTDYEAFQAALTANASREFHQADLAAIQELKAAADVINKWQDAGPENEDARREIAEKLTEAGEFNWESTLTAADVTSGDWTARLNLPPLPAPLSIVFMLDQENEPGNWQQFKAGDRVRFVGRFIDIRNGTDIVAAIRFPAEAAAAIPNVVPPRPAATK
jgi:hypothetical protein